VDINQILAELRQERDHIDQSILALQRLGASKGPRRGRPPKWLAEAAKTEMAEVPKRRGRPPGSKKKSPK
jgi:hypothetical protein